LLDIEVNIPDINSIANCGRGSCAVCELRLRHGSESSTVHFFLFSVLGFSYTTFTDHVINAYGPVIFGILADLFVWRKHKEFLLS